MKNITLPLDAGRLPLPAIPARPTQPHLIYGRHYHVWKNGEYLGKAVWSQDYVGPYVENFFESTDTVIYKADQWELV